MDKFPRIFKVRKDLAEAALVEVKERIAAKKLEEGVFTSALAKLKGLRAVKQAGNVVKDLKDTAGAIGPRQKLYQGIGKTKLGAAKANAGAVGRGIANTAKANPIGAAVLGGGAFGAGGLTAWGLKKPKNVNEGATFDFSKLKDKSKDSGESKGKEALEKAKEKAKGKDKDKRVKYFKNEKGDQLARHGGPMIGKKRKERGKQFVEDLKKTGAKEIDKVEYKTSGFPAGRFTKRRNRGGFGKGPKEFDINVYKKG
jgi:hypothetical protein